MSAKRSPRQRHVCSDPGAAGLGVSRRGFLSDLGMGFTGLALGAMLFRDGIARAFAYGGHKGRLIYHPDHKPEMHDSFEAYKSNSGPSINHFYEKLLLLKDRMNTPTGKKIAEQRHQFVKQYLMQFFKEWNGES